ncbi:MAG: hypothetical protein KBT55_08100 [Porticoccus sp.]|nr:hypothetical protein [Porticoccus sp.]
MEIVSNFNVFLRVRFILVVAFFSMSTFNVFGSEFQLGSVISAQIEHRCSINKDVYLSCLNMDESECKSIFSNAYNSCDTDGSELLFDINDQQSIDVFSVCVEQKLQEHLVAKGVDLDAVCE